MSMLSRKITGEISLWEFIGQKFPVFDFDEVLRHVHLVADAVHKWNNDIPARLEHAHLPAEAFDHPLLGERHDTDGQADHGRADAHQNDEISQIEERHAEPR